MVATHSRFTRMVKKDAVSLKPSGFSLRLSHAQKARSAGRQHLKSLHTADGMPPHRRAMRHRVATSVENVSVSEPAVGLTAARLPEILPTIGSLGNERREFLSITPGRSRGSGKSSIDAVHGSPICLQSFDP
jgi:hypothetical protein